MAVSIGDAVLKVGVDKKDFDRKMTGIGASIKKHQKAIGVGMMAVGGAILAAGAMSVKTFAAMGDEVQKMALRTGFSTEALSELRHAAQLSGASLAGLEKASRTLSGTILDAGYGLESYTRAFDKIGVNYKELARLSPEKQFITVMEALAGVTSESERAALATDLFGRAGTQLLPMLADGADGLKNMREEAHTLGIVFDQEAADKAAAFNDALTKLKGSMSGVMIEIGSFIVDYIKPLVDKITETIKKYTAWADEHETLDKAIKGTVLALGGLLLVMGTLIVLKVPAMIAAFISFGKVLLFTVVPAVWAFVTALWAQVTATLAAMAATGVLIPAAIAAVAAIALLATGITLLVKNQKKQYDATNETTEAIKGLEKATDEYIPVATEATGAVDTLSAAMDKVAKKTSKAEKAFRGYMRALGSKAGGYTEAEWKILAPVFTHPKGFAGFAPGTAGFYKALGIAGYQEGGIITKPTLAMIGEKGPEAVIPLGKGMGTANIYVELDGRIIARAIGQPLVDEIRLRTGVHI